MQGKFLIAVKDGKVTHIDDCEKLRLYFLRTDDFYAVKKIFTDFIEFGKRPDLSAWKCKYIGL